jgi:hypothetical protein
MPQQQMVSFAAAKLSSDKDLQKQLSQGNLFTKLQQRLAQVTIDGDIYYVAEGDTLLDIDQLSFYADTRQKEDEAFRALRQHRRPA